MSVREQQVNDALRVLDEMHRLHRIERDEYRLRRRHLLESLGDRDECTVRDTVRRAVPAGDTPPRRSLANPPEAAATHGRWARIRWVALGALLLGLAVGIAAVCWVTTMG
jgi:hypothetical protein